MGCLRWFEVTNVESEGLMGDETALPMSASKLHLPCAIITVLTSATPKRTKKVQPKRVISEICLQLRRFWFSSF